MAEFVEKHMESMMDEMAELQRLKLCTPAETKAILKKRNFYECKINGPVKNLSDYKDYIRLLTDLLKDIKLRRKKFRITERKNKIEMRIIKRIKYLYEIAILRYSNDFDLSLAYFKFCKESNFIQAASLAITNMLKNFSQLPQAWQVAAGWYMKDIKQALSIIHKGLLLHPKCEALYIEAIEMELLSKEKDWDTNSKSSNVDEICCQKIDTYVNTILENIDQYSCLMKICTILDGHSFTEKVLHKILHTLMTRYCNHEEVWQWLADRERNGHHYPAPEVTSTSTKFRLTRSIEKFEEGLAKICQEKQIVLWILYIEYLIDLYQQKGVSHNVIKNTLLKNLQKAKRLSILTEEYYIVWVKLLTDEDEILHIIEEGIKAFPQSVELWKLKLKYKIMKQDVSELNKEFKLGHLSLKEKAAPLWQLIIKYHVLSSPNQVVENIYKDAVVQPAEISNLFKPEYLRWVSIHKGLEAAREVYRNLSLVQPYCKELHSQMATIELNDININVKEIEKPLKLACEQFGSQDADVWINLRNCYLEHHHLFEEAYSTFDINIKSKQIEMEAEAALKDNVIMLAEFRNKLAIPVDF